MPIIQLHGAWTKLPMNQSLPLYDELKKVVAAIPELELKPGQVSCLFETPFIHNENEILVFVLGLFEKPSRTEKVRQKLAETIRNVVAHRFPKHYIEVFIDPFDPRKGFAATHHPS